MLGCAPLFVIAVMLTACGGGGGGAGGGVPDVSQGASPATLGGFAQKGPFLAGSELRAALLDAHGYAVDTQVAAGVLGDNGRLSIQVPWTGPTLVKVTGSFFDENTGLPSAHPVILDSIVELEPQQQYTGNVNLFTHLLAARTRALMSQGHSCGDAMQAARIRLIGTFGLALANGAMPDQLDLTQGDSADNANLLLFSAAIGLLPPPDPALDPEANPFQYHVDRLAYDFAMDESPEQNWLADVRESARNVVLENLYHPQEISNPPSSDDLSRDELPWLNAPPTVINPGAQSSAEGDAVSLRIAASDADGDALSYSASGLPPGLTMAAASGVIGGTLEFHASTGSPYTVSVTVSDGIGDVDTIFSWAVSNTDQHPQARVDEVTIDYDDTAYIDVLANDLGLGDGGLGLTISAQPQQGSASVAGLTVVYVPDAGFTGYDSFLYRVQDADGDAAEASVQVICTSCADGVIIRLSWDPNPPEEALHGYRVFFGNTADAVDTKLSDFPLTATGFDPAAPGVQYDAGADLRLHFGDQACFRQKAYKRAGDSDFSQAACLRLQPPMDCVSQLPCRSARRAD